MKEGGLGDGKKKSYIDTIFGFVYFIKVLQ